MHNHVLIPVAPGHEDEYSSTLAHARALLGDGGKITVLSVLEELPNYVVALLPSDQVAQNLTSTEKRLHEAFGSENVEIDVVMGHSAQTILDWAEKHSVDLIVILSHRPGFSDLFLGTTASRVVRYAQCPVLVLR